MAEKLVIVVGDTTSHGGLVTEGSVKLAVTAKPIASIGDQVICPEHGVTQIIEGAAAISLEQNKLIAYAGCKTSCGASLIANMQQQLRIEVEEF